MKSRVASAPSMAFDFDYFLLDEITAVGDKLFRQIAADALAKREHPRFRGISSDAHPVSFVRVVYTSP